MHILMSIGGPSVSNLAEDPATGRLFAGTHGEGIHASDDGGRTWQRRDHGVAHANIFSMSVARGDGGETWEELSSLRSAPTVDQWMFPVPPHAAHVKHVLK